MLFSFLNWGRGPRVGGTPSPPGAAAAESAAELGDRGGNSHVPSRERGGGPDLASPELDYSSAAGGTFSLTVLRAGQFIMRARSGTNDFFLDYEGLLALDEGNPKRRVKTHVLDKQPRVKVGGVKGAECLICMEPFKYGTEVMQLPCRHRFCAGCIRRWLESAISCPICRYKFPESQTFLSKGK